MHLLTTVCMSDKIRAQIVIEVIDWILSSLSHSVLITVGFECPFSTAAWPSHMFFFIFTFSKPHMSSTASYIGAFEWVKTVQLRIDTGSRHYILILSATKDSQMQPQLTTFWYLSFASLGCLGSSCDCVINNALFNRSLKQVYVRSTRINCCSSRSST